MLPEYYGEVILCDIIILVCESNRAAFNAMICVKQNALYIEAILAMNIVNKAFSNAAKKNISLQCLFMLCSNIYCSSSIDNLHSGTNLQFKSHAAGNNAAFNILCTIKNFYLILLFKQNNF